MNDPFPKEFVIDAWKAKVGYSLDNSLTQDACIQLVIAEDCSHKSILRRRVCMKHY